jgi:hypothetical protein
MRVEAELPEIRVFVNGPPIAAMGEDVNLAARLESVPPLYGCFVVAGEHTARPVQKVFLMRELDWLLVKGADKPMSVYQPIAELDSVTDPEREVVGALRKLSNDIERGASPKHIRFGTT